MSPRQGSPRTRSSSWKQLLGQVEGHVYFLFTFVTFTLSVSETLNVTVTGSCEQLSFTPEVLLNSSVTPEMHLIMSLGVLDTTVHLMKLLLFSVCRLVTCHMAVPCLQNCSGPLSIPTALVFSKPVSATSRLAVSFPSSPGKHLALLTAHGNSRLSHCRGYCKILNLQIIEANLNGELNLKIETELVCVTTHFKDLGNPPLASKNASQDRNSEQMAEVHIDIRKLLQFLAGQQVNPTKATCNIVKDKIVHFDLLHEDVSLQYFIPALS
ncbi:checkpoint protein HUS1 isoform X3 [Moschus berezovskii]|uniref:checkpoint protein HUS1 isoform X3 n=1 Tax=Moschus berezovskii TaxID=68408 RepID=UPI00244505BD|nr:checkpoint protein HUS1 isoform X3 [Moschus berezovskii]